MRSADTLIRLAKHRVDSVQKLIASAEKTRADMERRLTDLGARAEKERGAAEANPAEAPTYLAFLQALKVQKANVTASITGVDEQLAALREDLRVAFEEQKTYELMEERRLIREAREEARREQAQADETAITRFGRR